MFLKSVLLLSISFTLCNYMSLTLSSRWLGRWWVVPELNYHGDDLAGFESAVLCHPATCLGISHQVLVFTIARLLLTPFFTESISILPCPRIELTICQQIQEPTIESRRNFINIADQSSPNICVSTWRRTAHQIFHLQEGYK